MKNSIACQVHIPPTGHQGDNLTAAQKLKVVELSIELMRIKNPDTYIAFSGHGKRPSNKILDLCDYVHWEDLKPYRKAAQYDSVHESVNNCREMGFDYILKLRADGVYGIKNFAEHCFNILDKENKILLVTQMTANIDNKLGDCVMYSDSKLMYYLWDKNHPEHHVDGLIHIGTNFKNYVENNNLTWLQLIKKHCSFRNISSLQWMDLRYNYFSLQNIGWDKVRQELIDDSFDLSSFYWGRNNGWHIFDDHNKMTFSVESFYLEEETFYES